METPNSLELPFRADTFASANSRPFIDIDDGRALARAIVDTIREPLLVLDKDLRVVTANRSFYLMFRMKRQDIQDRPIYALGDGQWNVPELRLLLGSIVPHHAVMDAYGPLANDSKQEDSKSFRRKS
jgi:PAS domain-containing protein